jgi:hypothetical protein
MLCSDFRAPRKNDPLLPDAGTWRNNHVYEGISDAPPISYCISRSHTSDEHRFRTPPPSPRRRLRDALR